MGDYVVRFVKCIIALKGIVGKRLTYAKPHGPDGDSFVWARIGARYIPLSSAALRLVPKECLFILSLTGRIMMFRFIGLSAAVGGMLLVPSFCLHAQVAEFPNPGSTCNPRSTRLASPTGPESPNGPFFGTDITSLQCGDGAVTTVSYAMAFGVNARVSHVNSVAIGTGATSTAPNQITLGGTGSSVRIGDIAASTAAQTGPRSLVTIDANGTLGSTDLANFTQQASQLASLAAGQLQLDASVSRLFEFRKGDRRDAAQGIAAAMAMGSAPMPSARGRTSYVFNLATFRGEQALGGSLMHRLNTERPFAISAGFSYSGSGNNGARVGIAGEF